MKAKIITLDNKPAGDIDLNDSVYGLEVRKDILARMVNYQLSKRRSGTHKVKNRGEVNGPSGKIYRQKGGGTARHRNRRVNIFVGGGRAFGPTPRSHAHDLTKKFRKLALRIALSSKVLDNKLIILDNDECKSHKTKDMLQNLQKIGIENALFITGDEVNVNFSLAMRNLPNIDVLPEQGANVYDILRRDTLIMTKAAVEKITQRLSL